MSHIQPVFLHQTNSTIGQQARKAAWSKDWFLYLKRANSRFIWEGEGWLNKSGACLILERLQNCLMSQISLTDTICACNILEFYVLSFAIYHIMKEMLLISISLSAVYTLNPNIYTRSDLTNFLEAWAHDLIQKLQSRFKCQVFVKKCSLSRSELHSEERGRVTHKSRSMKFNPFYIHILQDCNILRDLINNDLSLI